ncbi:MAG: hypothetical protein AAFX50_11430, partial [Acidobacteriota bacterium]
AVDPLGLTVADALCVLRWTLGGVGAGGLTGIAAGCAAGGGVGVLAGGVGAIPGCGGGAVTGGTYGAVAGGIGGFLAGTLACTLCDTILESRKNRGRWKCTARCHNKNFAGVPIGSGFVTGFGKGPTRSLAAQAAKKQAASRTARGVHSRHCQTTRCWR